MYYAQIQRSNWWSFIGKHHAFAVIAFFVVLLLFFLVVHGIWGEDHAILIGNSIPGHEPLPAVDEMIEKLSLNELRVVKYFNWVGGLFTGDWGDALLPSYAYPDFLE
jgi:dipeptide transport system permease protein